MSSYYDLLEIPKTATKEEITKAYRKMALKWHPDRNPNNKEKAEEMFKKIGEAHEVLNDDNKRSIYDRFGEEGLKNGAGGNPFDGSGFNPFDLFSNMFGGGMPGMNMNMGGGNKNDEKPIVHEVKCTLKEAYTGSKKIEVLDRLIFCNGCDGTGFKDKQKHSCSNCNGKGVQIMMHQIGPGMVQQSTRTCTSCKGTGSDGNHPQCEKCSGKKKVKETIRIEVDIKRGIKKGQQVLFRNQGNQISPTNHSDIIVVFDVLPNTLYTRKGNDLHRKVDISLRKALLGFEMVLDHLDGKNIIIKSHDVIQPNTVKYIPNLGFTDLQNGTTGDYYIEFNVIFPEKISSKQLKALDIVFNKEDEPNKDGIDLGSHYKLENIPGNRYYKNIDEDSEANEEPNGRHNVQCAQQ